MSTIQLIIDGIKVYESGGVIPPPPDPPPIGGTYDAEVKAAISIDKEIYAGKGVWGFNKNEGGANYTVPTGTTVYFLANPSVNGLTNNIRIFVMDYAQYVTGGRHQGVLIPIDSNNNLVQVAITKKKFPLVMLGDNGTATQGLLPTTNRYLIKVTQNGESVPLSIFYAR